MDGPGPMSVDVATGKARTAALTRQPSKLAEDRIKDRMGFLSVAGFVPLRGGIPAMYQGQCVGGIGISGAPSPEADEEIAIAGAAALAR
jgi:glc operon protein GlcG